MLKAGLKVFCPLCRDEFMEANIGLAMRRAEERERRPSEVVEQPKAEPTLFQSREGKYVLCIDDESGHADPRQAGECIKRRNLGKRGAPWVNFQS